MAAKPSATIDIGRPYWRLSDEEIDQGGSLVDRITLAIRPVVNIAMNAAPKTCAAICAMQIVSAIATISGLLLINEALKSLLGEDTNVERLESALPALILIFLVYAAKLLSDTFTAFLRAKLPPIARRVAETKLLEKGLYLPLTAFENAQFYDRLKRARDRGILHLEGSITSLIDAMSATFSVLAAVVALAALQPLLVPLLLLSLLPGGWGAMSAARVQYAGMVRSIALMRHVDMYKDLATGRAAAGDIRTNQAETFVIDNFAVVSGELETHLISIAREEARLKGIASALSGIGIVLAFVALGMLISGDLIALSIAGTAVIAMRTASASLGQLVATANELFEKALYISDFQEFLESATGEPDDQPDICAPSAPKSIELRNVEFRYPDSDRAPALRAIDLTIEAGQSIAIVGENGSGKTTLAKLLAGLFPPTSGKILWDGIDTSRMSLARRRSLISMVPQDPLHWPHSARINVEIGRTAATGDDRNRFRYATDRSGAADVIDNLPNGWDTLLSREFRGGQDLSGGQWQKLAVARGLYREAPIIIWDEPTAALDAKAELAAYRSLREATKGRTSILITHRLTSVRGMDRILFLEGGHIVEDGSHEELIANGGPYAELFGIQSQLYELTQS